jgi:hypothetical protein
MFIAMVENDYMSSRANLLMEFDIPKTAIRKLDYYIPETINENDLIKYIQDNQFDIAKKAYLSSYEYERIKKEIL